MMKPLQSTPLVKRLYLKKNEEKLVLKRFYIEKIECILFFKINNFILFAIVLK